MERRLQFAIGTLSFLILMGIGIGILTRAIQGILQNPSDKDFTIKTSCSFVGLVNHGMKDCRNSSNRGRSHSQYLCVEIRVSYHDLDGVERIATIRENDHNNMPCSYVRCRSQINHTTEEIRNIVSRWNTTRPPSTSPCYINQHNVTQVIETPRSYLPHPYVGLAFPIPWITFALMWYFCFLRIWLQNKENGVCGWENPCHINVGRRGSSSSARDLVCRVATQNQTS